MVEVAWGALGLLAATLLGTLFYLGNRIDGLGDRIDALSSRVEAGFDHVNGRIDSLYGLLANHLDRHAG